MILKRVFERRDTGFYVDVGAYHPQRFSNTFLFYKRGWSGVNIDATPGSMLPFRRRRPRDINIEAAVTRDGRDVTLRLYDEPAMNSLASRESSERDGGVYEVVAERRVKSKTLREILEQQLPGGRQISFLSVDVEGLDLEVLESNDWNRFRPQYVLFERLGLSAKDVVRDPAALFLEEQGYEFFAKTVNSVIFRDTLSGAAP